MRTPTDTRLLPLLLIVLVAAGAWLLLPRFASTMNVSAAACQLRPSGDANCDGVVDITDFELFRKEFMQILTTQSADFNTDGTVSIVDFEIWRSGCFSVGACAAPSSIPTATRVPSPTITPTKSPTTSPSGEAMPVGDLPGWKQAFTEDFNTPVTLGNFPGTAYKNKFTVYLDGWPDTAGKQGKPSRYYPSKVISVANGVLNKHLHTENGTPMGAAILPILGGTSRGSLYGKYTVRFRTDALMKGFKTAWLLWPDVGGNLQYGEIDFPEGDLAGTIHAYMHHINATSNGDQDAFSTTALYTSWHTSSIEWSPGKVVFILDGKVIGTTTTRVPNTSMHWVLQTESCLTTCPAATTEGNVQIDWVVAYTKQ